MTLSQWIASGADADLSDADAADAYNTAHGWSNRAWTAQELADELVEQLGDHTAAQTLMDALLGALGGSDSPSVALMLANVQAGQAVRLASAAVRPVLLAATSPEQQAVLIPLLRAHPLATEQDVTDARARHARRLAADDVIAQAQAWYESVRAVAQAHVDDAQVQLPDVPEPMSGGGE